jgi:peptide deformylase
MEAEMAIRNIRKDGDEILRKKCKEVCEIDSKVKSLIKDMAETMYEANGVGLAAPQVGILKRIVVIDTGNGLFELINPEIISEKGEQSYVEGCLSMPGIFGETRRPAEVVVEALDPEGEKVTIRGDKLLAVALCHEIDHLDGILFKDKVVRFINKDEVEN